ncbi:divergent CRAL/TRIO domain-containing protein [Gymnopilus junonius]|uniref:Divergent CRAL/TRIO domain-containing protein n=1 Tax=Gymnopilus junonius TaxID=109634 RepID=A0A9P5TIX4_GYMJU|nr:divergent CRAL/TRIO domain-containing protein [Gymnopilus junonius]
MPPATFNLKQRLAALSLAQSSPSPPHGANLSHTRNGDGGDSYLPSPTRRKLFTPPNWLKKPQASSTNSFSDDAQYRHGEEEKKIVQDVLTRMIFQAGVDFETRPMVVLNASTLPDPQTVSYDLLLSRILSYLDLYVEADYTVVFFAAGSKHAPSWNWVWKAYRSLSRKYRKNLKQLYIVHSSFFSKMLFSLAGAIISPKFFRKLEYIKTLSELAQHVPLTQIDIPPAVYQENQKYERKITLPVPTRSNIFGVPLEELMGYDGEKGGIPRVVRDSIQFLRETGRKLFNYVYARRRSIRRSPSSALLRAAQEAYDRGNVVSLGSFGDPHLAAVLLKKYLRDLPEPIFPESTYGSVRSCPMPTGDNDAELAAITYVREIILPELVPCAHILLSQVLHLLHDVSLRSDYNRMDSTNLAIVICPNLVKSPNPMRDVMMCSVPLQSQTSTRKITLGMVIALCIRRYYEVFDEVVDRSEAVAPWRALRNQGFDGASSGSGSPSGATYVLGDEEDDDEMLVMPVGNGEFSQDRAHLYGTKRHKNTLSNASSSKAARSVFNDSSAASTSAPSAWSGSARNGKAKSMISIERGHADGNGTVKKGGTISVGRDTTRKGSGALSRLAPPVPKIGSPTRVNTQRTNEQNDDEEERVMSFEERRKRFEGGT